MTVIVMTKLYINVLDFQNIQSINLRTALETLTLSPIGE